MVTKREAKIKNPAAVGDKEQDTTLTKGENAVKTTEEDLKRVETEIKKLQEKKRLQEKKNSPAMLS